MRAQKQRFRPLCEVARGVHHGDGECAWWDKAQCMSFNVVVDSATGVAYTVYTGVLTRGDEEPPQ